MARGNIHLFEDFIRLTKDGTAINLATDAINMGIVSTTIVPTTTTPVPTWGAAGTTNFAANEVATGTAYSAGGPALASVTYADTTVNGSFTASIAANIMTVTAVASGSIIIGQTVSGTGVTATKVVAYGTGTGGVGTYIVDVSQTVASEAMTTTGSFVVFNAAGITINQDTSTGLTNGYYGIFYDSTDANKHCIGFIDLGGSVSIQGGALAITFNAAGIFSEWIA